MIEVGGFRSVDCRGIGRRSFVRAGLAAPFVAGVPGLAERQAQADRARAKSVLLVWLMGAPSHLDTFDPKPNAPVEYRGPFSTIATRTPGSQFCELLPKLAARSNRFSVVRSHENYSGDHLVAASMGLTGGPEGAGGHPPNFGSIVGRRHAGAEFPPFISLARGPVGDGRGPMKGYGGGAWGKAYDPFMVSCSEQGAVDIPGLKLLDGLTPRHLQDRQTLLRDLDRLRSRLDTGGLDQWDHTFRSAYSLLTSPEARRAFDLSSERKETRDAYGQTSFGQSCLLGRRLVEAGVPYVQVNWSQFAEVLYPFSDYGWDTHANNFGLLADWHCPLLDHAFSVLLDDLDERGLLETTLVVCMGEFGRTPRINSIGSRDHWHRCYSSIWAGGGVQPGRIVGESDAKAESPVTEPIGPARVGATMLEALGVGPAERAELKVLEGVGAIHELL